MKAATVNGLPEVSTGPFTSLVDPGFHPFTPKSSPTKTQKRWDTVVELEELVKAGDRKKIKSFLRSNQWRADHAIRSKLWQEVCMTVFRLRNLKGAYQDMVTEVFGQGGYPFHFFSREAFGTKWLTSSCYCYWGYLAVSLVFLLKNAFPDGCRNY